MTVRGVDHEHVHPGGGERLRLDRDVAVDPDRRGDAEPAAGVHAGRYRVERSALAAAERADDVAVVQHRREFEVGRDHEVERLRGRP